MPNLSPKPLLQSGFALIPVLLLIVGITAGTLLVQNRTNFLPKAQQSSIPNPDDRDSNPTGVSVNRAVNKNLCPNQCTDAVKSICYQWLPNYPSNTGIEFTCGAQITKTNMPKEFGYRIFNVSAAECRGVCSSSQKCILAYRQGGSSKPVYDYVCADIDVPEGFVPAAAPAAAQPASGQPLGISNQQCNARQKETCNEPSQPKGGCVVDNAGGGWCKYEAAREGTKCNEDTHGKGCGSAECRVIDGVPRCLSTQCTSGENSYCAPNGECTVGDKTIDGEKFSYTYCKLKAGAAPAAPTAAAPRAVGQPVSTRAVAPPAAPAAAAPRPAPESPQKAGSFDNKVAAVECPDPKHREYCTANASSHGVSTGKCYQINGKARCQYGKDHASCNPADSSACSQRGGCVLEKITVGSDPIQFSRCADDQSSSTSSASSGTTGCENLKDADGLTIPCYRIGVFTPEELKATEAQAKVALERYTQYKRILSDVGAEIDGAIKAKADEKIREAERLANACLAK